MEFKEMQAKVSLHWISKIRNQDAEHTPWFRVIVLI